MAPYSLLCAEKLMGNGRTKSWESVEDRFLDTIETARRHGGYLAVEAYSYERLAGLAADRNDDRKSRKYLGEALATYTKWGATEKIKQLSPLVYPTRVHH